MMMATTKNYIRPRTVNLLTKLMKPLIDEGIVTLEEFDQIRLNLKHMSKTGTLFPVVVPRLVDQHEAADMLGISYSNFRKLFREDRLPISSKRVGSSIRFRNTDIIKFIMSDKDTDIAESNN